MKAGSVVDLVEAEEMVRQAIDIAESTAGVQLESVVVSMSGGRLGSERFIATIDLGGGAVTNQISGGCWRPQAAIPCAMGAPSSIHCRSAMPSMLRQASASRGACSDTVWASICTWSPPMWRRFAT